MAEIHHISKRHIDFADESRAPATLRIPRPLRDLLRASRNGLHEGCRIAWGLAAVAPGDWVSVDPAMFAGDGGGDAKRIRALLLRAKPSHLDMRMGFARGAHASAIGQRVIVVAEPLPDTALTTLVGRPLHEVATGPFLEDPALRIINVIHRAGERMLDIRCRCPSHVVHPHGHGAAE